MVLVSFIGSVLVLTFLRPETLFATTSSANKKHWGFQIFQKALKKADLETVPMLFTKNFMRSWINHLSKRDRNLHKIALQTVCPCNFGTYLFLDKFGFRQQKLNLSSRIDHNLDSLSFSNWSAIMVASNLIGWPRPRLSSQFCLRWTRRALNNMLTICFRK